MDPLISVVMPVGRGWEPYLLRNLAALEQQTFNHAKFEVIVSTDGFYANKLRDQIDVLNISYSCTAVMSPRNSQKNKAHRNHARNKGCAKARGEILWVLDCDHMPSPRCLSGIAKCHALSIGRGTPPVIAFPTFSMTLAPRSWISRSQDLLSKNRPKIWPNKANDMRIADQEFDSKSGHYKVGELPRRINSILENSPAFPAFFYHLLDGYDEGFLGWGGNKQEFCRRLNGLKKAGLADLWVVRDAMLVHQSHKKAKDKDTRTTIKHNERIFNKKESGIQDHAEWWRKQIQKVEHYLRSHPDYAPRARTLFVADNPCGAITKEILDEREHWSIFAINADKPIEGALCANLPRHCSLGEKLLIAERAARPYTLVYADVSQQPTLKKLTKVVIKARKNGLHYNNYILAVQGESIHNAGEKLLGLESFEEIAAVINAQQDASNLSVFKGSSNLKKHHFFHPKKCAQKPKICIGIITYNRLDMLQTCLKSLCDSMRPGKFDYNIYVTDDGSTDGTVQWLEQEAPDFIEWDTHARGGIAVQSNRVLQHFDGNVEYGFLCNDDIIFAKGWEAHYISAIDETPYDHFVLMDLEHMGLPDDPKPYKMEIHNGIHLVNWRKNRIQGAMLTFTQRVIDKVGGMDAKRFGMTNHEHVDWTIRNRRAGLAPGGEHWSEGCFDVLGGNQFIWLNKNNYRQAAPQVDKHYSQKQFDRIKNNSNRIYVPISVVGGKRG